MKHFLYDFDGTIYDKDSSKDFILYCFLKNKKLFLLLPKFFIVSLKYKLKKISTKEYKENIFSFLKKVNNHDELIESFWLKHESKIKEFYLKKDHKNDIIITASPSFLIKPIAKKLEVLDLIATDMKKNTGEIIGENCKGYEKVNLYRKKYPSSIIEEMYSDSLNDKPLLDLARRSFIVKKNKIIRYKGNNV